MTYTVEKIGGTSMSDFDTVLDNILLRPTYNRHMYDRAFVVSAYGGFTDALLECKRTQHPGVYQLIANSDDRWREELETVERRMLLTNEHMFADPMERIPADNFIRSRIAEAKSCISNLLDVCQYGQFDLAQYLPQIREFLASIGEVHSAYNTATKLKGMGINAKFVDLSMWDAQEMPETLDDCIQTAFESIDVSHELPIVTGYAASQEGVMSNYDRGYSEMTFSRLACVTKADLAIIHKEYHLSTADPRLVGAHKVQPIGETNFDVADQLSSLGMEAIHPNAAEGLRKSGIRLQIKNTFEPEHKGTMISEAFQSEDDSVEIVAGKDKVHAVHLFDQDKACQLDSVSLEVMKIIADTEVGLISKEMDANSLTYYLNGNTDSINQVQKRVKLSYPEAQIKGQTVAVVSAIGSSLNTHETLAIGTQALINEGIAPIALHAPIRNVSVQYIVEEAQYKQALSIVHDALCNINRTSKALSAA
ncbi:aspartate kinase [Vibrio sp. YMD68]|uniref:aspartate kinase n=1 Tax=Vibrio sp. YMD68 TaxID=3042300 RepID=UPI00249ABFC2|nr:aspartate kinase [Vibrio sp. YMD68]WGV99437.1 aspartate kinase [Vibrio sp. YMD68]